MTRASRRGAPLIGITSDLLGATADGTARQEPTLFLPLRYCRAVENAGGMPLILPCTASPVNVRRLLEPLAGVLISGGNFDIHPSYYGERPIEGLGAIKQERTEFELELTAVSLKRDLPILGICGGAQAINVALGGSLYQDIARQVPSAGEHQQSAHKEIGGHTIQIHPGTQLERILQRRTLEANTTHHQAVKKLGRGLVVNATADDGMIEGIESPQHAFALGVQWHPEVLARRSPHHRKIFAAFVAICTRLHSAC